MAQIEWNDKAMEQFGIKRLVVELKGRAAPKVKRKGKEHVQEDCDNYVPKKGDENESDDTSEVLEEFTYLLLVFIFN